MFKPLSKPIYCAALGLFTLTLGTTASAQDYKVEINKTQILHLPGPASAVVIGNPEIADVSVHSQDTLFLVGRSYGETSLIVLDAHGQTIISSNVLVGQTMSENGVRLYKMGEGRETYSCAPQCLPAPVLGDALNFRTGNQSEAAPINSVPVSGVSPSGPNSGNFSSQMMNNGPVGGPPMNFAPVRNFQEDR